ncbi:WXG100 family type VII secretion target [Saccharopolyspora thermophila]|uniref:Putative T7SS secretion signal domain-containing protein n=1 Tax=Saccharopolyspora thermophila TaxID=89367 RepID=A0ABP3N3H8_9PSEU
MTAELGTTQDPKALIPGDAGALQTIAQQMTAYGDALHNAGTGLRRIDTTEGWSGAAADSFRDVFDGEPPKWLEAGDAFHDGAAALTSYAATLSWAQTQAQEAIRLWNEGDAAAEQAKAAHDQAVQRAQKDAAAKTANGTPTTAPAIPFHDPGEAKRAAARELLDRARDQLRRVGDTAADELGKARDKAPEHPGFWDGVGDVLGDIGDGLVNIGTHLVNDLASVGNAMLNHPTDVAMAAAGVGLMAISAGGEGLGIALDATGVGSIAGVPLNAISTAGIVTGAGMVGAATMNIVTNAAGDDHVEPLDETNNTTTDTDGTPPGVKDGWEVRTADNGKGTVYQEPGATGNANMVRIMDPKPGYPHGYVRFYNEHGQPVGLNGKPGPNSQTHIPLRPDGSYPVPEGW